MGASEKALPNALDTSPLLRSQLFAVGLIVLALTLDGLDLQLLGIVAPFVIADLGVTREAFAPALAAAVLGLALGSSLGGVLGDKFGTKRVLLCSMAFFGVMTITSSFVMSLEMLMAVRFVSGLAFGAATPNGLALGAEWLPKRSHPMFSSLASICTPLGGLIGAGLTLVVVPIGGWRTSFVVAGGLTLLTAAVMWWRLPESAAYLAAKGRVEDAKQVWRRIHQTEANIAFTDLGADAEAYQTPRGRLFTAPLLRMNIGAPLGFFSIAYVTYSFLSWTPVMLNMSGFTMLEAVRGSIAYNTFALVAPLGGGFLISRYGSRAVLIGSAGATMIILVALGALLESRVHIGSGLLSWTVLAGFGVVGGLAGIVTAGMYAVLTHGWPVNCRATGMGFGFMMGRIGGFTAILTSGRLLGLSDQSVLPIFIAAVMALTVVIAAAMIVDRHVPGRNGRGRSARLP